MSQSGNSLDGNIEERTYCRNADNDCYPFIESILAIDNHLIQSMKPLICNLIVTLNFNGMKKPSNEENDEDL